MKKIDKKTELLKKLQVEQDRRTQVENEADRLICNEEYEKAAELLESLDDQIVRDIEAELDKLDQEPEEEVETEEFDEQAKQFLNIVVALRTKSETCFEQVIQRHAEKLLKLQNGR